MRERQVFGPRNWRSRSGLRVPASVGPELAADRRVADHEVDRVGDLGGIDQPLELRVGKDILFDVLLPQRPHHRGVGETRVNDRERTPW